MIDTQTLPAVAPETVTPLRPSEALRLGRLTRPIRGHGELLRAEQLRELPALVSGHELLEAAN